MGDIVIKAENLSKEYRLGTINHGTLKHDLQSWWARIRGKEDPNSIISFSRQSTANSAGLQDARNPHFLALKDVSFEVKRGEILGIIGKNGAGKSTLLKILSQVTSPTKGVVKIRGRIASLLEVGTGFHPELTGRENIFLNGAILGMTKKEISRKFDEIVYFAEVEKFVDTPVKRYSSGMYVRLAFAVAAHLEPEILIVDEVLAVGDAQFQKKCLGKMEAVGKEGRTILFVSHNMAAVQQLTNRSILLERGVLQLNVDTPSAVQAYLGSGPASAETTEGLKTNREDFKINSIAFNYSDLEKGFNKPLRFDIKYEISKDKDDVLFAFAIVNSIGAKILTSRQKIEKLPAIGSQVSLVLRDHHLPPGTYFINFAVALHGNSIFYQENVLKINLSDAHVEDFFLIKKKDVIGAYIPCEIFIQ